ncbi:hypothetical protein COCON_G00011510 [Conger conger]|uniref:RabBD domain-containing protein n=1 Tax=Conger conger TaxID=82655 RepID=A0A9Q1I7B0_CONCO|nr:hypothetical protein COCON_G00011510 [Conger conger]
MSAPHGPRGGPAAPPADALLPEVPDLSHLTEEEKKIILGVMDRQKKEVEKEQSMLKHPTEGDARRVLQTATKTTAKMQWTGEALSSRV